MSEKTYKQQTDENNLKLINNMCEALPSYVSRFKRGIIQSTATSSLLGYIRNIKDFLEYIADSKDIPIMDVTLQMLSDVDTELIETYMDYLTCYEKNGVTRTNGRASIKRRLSSLSVFYRYLYKNDLIEKNAFSKVDKPKLKEKQIIRMDAAETAKFLDTVEYGISLTEHQQKYHEKYKIRDLAVMTLMLSSGIRISECVGLNLTDINIEETCMRVIRKGGKEAIVYFSDEAADALSDYMELRKNIEPAPGHENALFLSAQKKRLSVRAIQDMVGKYAKSSAILKHITPHKLRSTFGTALYQETSDIYLVADVLGHSDVNTTRKHYADIEDNRKRSARNKVTLREKPTGR